MEPSLDADQPFGLEGHPFTGLGSTQKENAPQLLAAHRFIEEPTDVGEGNPEITESQDPVQAVELVRGVPTMTGLGVGPPRTKETELVVVAERPHRDLGHASDRSDPVHATIGSDDVAEGSSGKLVSQNGADPVKLSEEPASPRERESALPTHEGAQPPRAGSRGEGRDPQKDRHGEKDRSS